MIELSEKKFERVLEVRGHLIDSMILTRIFDKIMDLKGDFNVLEFKIGKRKNESQLCTPNGSRQEQETS